LLPAVINTQPVGSRKLNDIVTKQQGHVLFSSRGLLPELEEQSQTCGSLSLSHSPSSYPPSFTQSPFPHVNYCVMGRLVHYLSDVQSRQAPAFINTCHDARFASHVNRKPTQPTTRHSLRGRTGRERPDVEADTDEGCPRLQADTNSLACVTVPQQHQPPQQQDTVHRKLCPCTGKGDNTGTGPPSYDTRTAAGYARALPPPTSALPSQTHTTRPQPTTTGRRKGEYPVVSNLPLHCVMQQRCHHTSASARSPSWQPMPRPRLQWAATALREKVQLPIREQRFFQKLPRIIVRSC
jgi:hypothetical protein